MKLGNELKELRATNSQLNELIVDTKEKQIRDSLMQLGWIPPKNKKVVCVVEEYLSGELLNIADPVQYAAEEYVCAMRVLDELGVPRKDGDDEYSLVGRIKWLQKEKEQHNEGERT